MTRLLKSLLLYFIVLFCSIQANAALNLELTQGIEGSIPIGITPFSDQESANISSIISRDLSNSGYFRVSMLPSLNNPIDFSALRARNIDNVVTGYVKGQGNYQVGFELLDVLSAQHRLLTQQFSSSATNLRRVAHHISDAIYEKLTGTRGVFSTRIAYVLVKRQMGRPPRYMLEVADMDGYSPKPILISTQPIMSPRWSPNGRYIAYVSFERKKAEIYISEVATGKRKIVSSFPGINGAPSWSPNGQDLAIVLSKSGKPKIYQINVATSHLRQLTSGIGIDTEPTWSPDGRSIVFTSDRGGTPQIYQMNLASGQTQRVTFNGDYNARPSFTPDGKQIVILHRENGAFSIALQDLHSDKMQILSRAELDESPSISPNGKMVLFATQYGRKGVLGVVSTDGRIQLRLPSREGNVQEPAWSPWIS